MIRFLSFFILALTFVSCSTKKPEGKKEIRFDYSAVFRRDPSACFIKTSSFNDETLAERFASILDVKCRSMVYIKRDSLSANERNYTVLIGPFTTAEKAGEAAFRLYKEKIIDSSYSLLANNRETADEFAATVFVGTSGGGSSLLSFNLKDRSIRKVWNRQGEEIVDFSYSGDRKSAFIVTVSSFGREGVFPFIKDVRLYRMDMLTGKTMKLKSYGNGLQIYPIRETSDSYRIVFIYFDSRISTYLIENNIVYSSSGRVISNKKRTFDLVRENFPPPPYQMPEVSSAGGRHSLEFTSNGDSTRVIIRDVLTRQPYSSFSLKGERINQLAWSDEQGSLVISATSITPTNRTLNSSRPETGCLVVYSLKERKILRKWTGGGYKNFLLKGNFLFFDDGFGKHSRINVYDLSTDKIIETLRLSDGCGIRNIPFIPDYSA